MTPGSLLVLWVSIWSELRVNCDLSQQLFLGDFTATA